MSRTVVLATRNAHKVAELNRILAEAAMDAHVVDLSGYPQVPEVPETEISFVGNATLKAVAVARATGLPAVADDSGLCVDVLGGAPGIFSARWCGCHGDDQANLELLLAQLADVPAQHRGAHFACAAVLALPNGATRVTQAKMAGVIVTKPLGENGFGYDPIFRPDGRDGTSAQLSASEKDAISHRGKAFRALAPHVRELVTA